MKTIFIAVLVIFSICNVASAGQFGPTEPTANQGKFSLGMGYSFEETKYESWGRW